ncbi:MAG: phosphoribosylglycinamide formyltransferase [Armatimonadetes bacterium]|nr:phosphoribosylglycinamide formyltransferase [Armatimonadota bacterium]
MSQKRVKMAIMVGGKGRGSNMANLIGHAQSPDFPAEATLVIGTRPNTPALERAKEMDVETCVLNPKDDGYAEALLDVLKSNGIELIALAGFLFLLPIPVLQMLPNRVINIHPALLPKFGGKGMYGMHVHEAVIAAGEAESGCTVHHVTEQYDEGAPILQLRCPVEPYDTPETLATRVLELEHEAYPSAIRQLLS